MHTMKKYLEFLGRKIKLGDMADWDIEQGFDMLADHLTYHRHFHPEDCPFCREEEENNDTRETD